MILEGDIALTKKYMKEPETVLVPEDKGVSWNATTGNPKRHARLSRLVEGMTLQQDPMRAIISEAVVDKFCTECFGYQ